VDGKQGPRKTRSGAPTQSIPGGLETAPDEQEPRADSLDQPDAGSASDRLTETRLDQPSREDGDRPELSLDQPSHEDSDRLDHSLDQAPQGASDRLNLEPEPDGKGRDPRGSDSGSDNLEYEGSRDGQIDGDVEHGTDEDREGRTPPGSPHAPRAWQKVTRKGKSHGERSDGSQDVHV